MREEGVKYYVGVWWPKYQEYGGMSTWPNYERACADVETLRKLNYGKAWCPIHMWQVETKTLQLIMEDDKPCQSKQ